MGLVNRVLPDAEVEALRRRLCGHHRRQRAAHRECREGDGRRSASRTKASAIWRCADALVKKCFNSTGLSGRPRGFHGKAQAGVHRNLMLIRQAEDDLPMANSCTAVPAQPVMTQASRPGAQVRTATIAQGGMTIGVR